METDNAAAASATASSKIIVPKQVMAADILFADKEKKIYWDRSHYDSLQSQMKALAASATLYVGNLAFSTRSAHVRAHFGQMGLVKKVHMGLDRMRKTPCGFCFVEYWDRRNALKAVSHLSGTKLDGRVIRVDLDAGFQPGRQYGRGVSGGQVRDDRRHTVDPARTGKLKWVPPNRNNNNNDNNNSSDGSTLGHYGPADASGGSKRSRDYNNDPDQRKNARYRESM